MSRTSVSTKDPRTKMEGNCHVYRTSESNNDSRNLDFALRNGLAGGVAGCVVSLTI
jgi:solute carrier family 25 protein 16